VEAFKLTELKGKCVDGALKLLKAMPRLVDLELSGSDVTYQFFLQRFSQLAALQLGAGATSLLKRFAHVGFCWGQSVAFASSSVASRPSSRSFSTSSSRASRRTKSSSRIRPLFLCRAYGCSSSSPSSS
jgi:hypothetical protein